MRAVALLIFALVVAACDSQAPPTPEVGSFEATLTGDVEATVSGRAGVVPMASGEGASIQLVPAPGGTPSLSFTGPIGAVGTYPVGTFDAGSAAATYRDDERFYYAVSGRLTVSDVTAGEIRGTFEVTYLHRGRPGGPAGSTGIEAEGSFTAVRY